LVQVGIQQRVPADPERVPEICRALMSFVGNHCANASELASDVVLATTEACDNVVRHAYPGKVGMLRFAARIDRWILVVVVADNGVGLRDAAATAGGGLGLLLIREVAHARIRVG